MKKFNKLHINSGERGSAGVKLLVTAIIIFNIGYAGYNYIPVAFQGQGFKEDLESAMIKAIVMPKKFGTPKELVKKKIQQAMNENDVPNDTFVDVQTNGNNISARVYYKKDVSILPFGLYNYEYVFDETVNPNGLVR